MMTRDHALKLLLLETQLTGTCPLRQARGCKYVVPDDACVRIVMTYAEDYSYSKGPRSCMGLAIRRYEEMGYDN